MLWRSLVSRALCRDPLCVILGEYQDVIEEFQKGFDTFAGVSLDFRRNLRGSNLKMFLQVFYGVLIFLKSVKNIVVNQQVFECFSIASSWR